MRLRLAQLTGVLLAALLCASCSEEAPEDPRGLTAMVSVEGSDTMTELMKQLADEYMKRHPKIPVSITSDNSGSGIAALINRTTDLAAASRELSPDEEKLVNARAEHLRKITIAGDSIAVLVNPKNPVSELTLKQVHDIFAGKAKSWKEVGGPKQAIDVYSREKASGTYSYFQQHVLNGDAVTAKAKSLPSAESISQVVAEKPWAVAYEGLANTAGAGAKVKLISLKMTDDGPAVAPTVASAINNYPLSRPLILFVDKHPKQSVRQFIEFCMSEDGQKIVTSAGFARLKK